ncbi:hypothetical protein V6N13_098379 [Hibiscus sabdariffa]
MWMIVEQRRRRPKKVSPTMDESSGVPSVATGSRINVLHNAIFEEEAKKNNGNSKRRDLVSNNAVQLGEGKSPIVEVHRPTISIGKHSTISITEEDGEHRASRKGVGKDLIAVSKVVQGDMLSRGLKGAGNHVFRRHFKEFMRNHRPQLVSLMETHLSGTRADNVIRRLGFTNSYRIEILRISNQFIHGQIRAVGSTRWLFFTSVYASPSVSKWKYLWSALQDLDPGRGITWLIGGDFNAILCHDERLGGSQSVVGVSRLFGDFVFDTSLIEAHFSCSYFTWCRDSLPQRLDRVLANAEWLDSFSDTHMLHLDRVNLS